MDSKSWKLLGTIVPAGCVGGCGFTGGALQITVPVVTISTSDFPLSLPLKKNLAGKQFSTDTSNMKQSVTLWLQALDTHFFYAEVQALMPKWCKFLIVVGDHTGVWCVPSVVHVQFKVRIEFVILFFETPVCSTVSSPSNLCYLFYASPKHH